MNRTPHMIFRVLVQAAWRRRGLLTVAFMLMVFAGFVAAWMLPRTYQATSLILLQENAKDNPFARQGDARMPERMQERVAGLQALLRSDRVLTKALEDLEEDAPRRAVPSAAQVKELRKLVSLELLGSEFIEFTIKGPSPIGLAKRLEAVTARFLESMLPTRNATTGAQVVLETLKRQLDRALRRKQDLGARLSLLLPNGLESGVERLAELDKELEPQLLQLTALERGLAGLASKYQLTAPYGDSFARKLDEARKPNGKGGLQSGYGAITDGAAATDLTKIRDLERRIRALRQPAMALNLRRAELRRMIDGYRSVQSRLAAAELALIASQRTYDEYSQRYASATSSHEISILDAPEKIVVIDRPRDPEAPMVASVMYIIGGIFSGLVISVCLAAAAEMAHPRIRFAHQVAGLTRLPLLASLPQAKRAEPASVKSTVAAPTARRRLAGATAALVVLGFVGLWLAVHPGLA